MAAASDELDRRAWCARTRDPSRVKTRFPYAALGTKLASMPICAAFVLLFGSSGLGNMLLVYPLASIFKLYRIHVLFLGQI
jgi:hypothetical protein